MYTSAPPPPHFQKASYAYGGDDIDDDNDDDDDDDYDDDDTLITEATVFSLLRRLSSPGFVRSYQAGSDGLQSRDGRSGSLPQYLVSRR